jgi:hypothetical protein
VFIFQEERSGDIEVILVSLPSIEDLQPQFDRLEANPGSVVLLAIEQPGICNFARVTEGWFSKEERKRVQDSSRTRTQKARDKLLQRQPPSPAGIRSKLTPRYEFGKGMVSANTRIEVRHLQSATTSCPW